MPWAWCRHRASPQRTMWRTTWPGKPVLGGKHENASESLWCPASGKSHENVSDARFTEGAVRRGAGTVPVASAWPTEQSHLSVSLCATRTGPPDHQRGFTAHKWLMKAARGGMHRHHILQGGALRDQVLGTAPVHLSHPPDLGIGTQNRKCMDIWLIGL
jgi:hypothetical protein